MFKAKLFIAYLICAFFTTGCQSCSTQGVQPKKLVKINLGGEPCTLDPRKARDISSQAVMRMLFEGLTRIGPTNFPELALAETIEVSKDLKTYTFILRPSQWSNGDPVTAADFVYSWQTTLSPGFLSDYVSNLYLIKNGRAVKEGRLPIEQLGVTAVNDHTLVVELEYPTPYFLELLSFPVFFPIHQGMDRKNPNWALGSDAYVSNGPFSLASWRHHDLLVAHKNPRFWASEEVELDGIEMVMVQDDTEMKLFQKKQLHWAGSPLSTVPVDEISHLKRKNQLHIQPISGTVFVRINTQYGPLQHPKLRRALALAIDRQALVRHVTQGEQLPATSLLPPSLETGRGAYFKDGDVQAAQILFQEALTELKLDRTTFPTLTFTYGASQRNYLIAQAIQQQWNQNFGIDIHLEAVDRKVYFNRISHQDYQLAYGDWLADFNDPINFLEVFKYKKQSTNNTHWENARYIELLDHSCGLIEQDKRDKLLGEAEGILMDAMPIIPIYHHSMLYLKDKELDGVLLTSLGHLDFRWATFHKSEE